MGLHGPLQHSSSQIPDNPRMAQLAEIAKMRCCMAAIKLHILNRLFDVRCAIASTATNPTGRKSVLTILHKDIKIQQLIAVTASIAEYDLSRIQQELRSYDIRRPLGAVSF